MPSFEISTSVVVSGKGLIDKIIESKVQVINKLIQIHVEFAETDKPIDLFCPTYVNEMWLVYSEPE